ncbi:MAG: MBOAT family O-acyltransferase [Myxococcota bacterium]
MLPLLLGFLALAPLYWLMSGVRLRRDFLSLASLTALGLYDWRLPVLIVAAALLLAAAGRRAWSGGTGTRRLGAAMGLLLLGILFVGNKMAGQGGGALPSQSGLALLGISYLALKLAAAWIELARGRLIAPRPRELLAWLAFLPTYPSGPIEELEHFRSQDPRPTRVGVLQGLERVLFGLVKALLLAHYLGVWVDPILAAPEGRSSGELLLGVYASTLRFYLDFAGYSDIAIGISALFGYEIRENFDSPLVRRNLVQLWQHWHITLTHWLRTYIFIPVSRGLMRHSGKRWEGFALAAGQLAAMLFCGLWHGLGWNFVLWGALQALGMIWVGLVARPIGRLLPRSLVAWWRHSRCGYAISTLVTFHAFALPTVLVVADVESSLHYLRLLFAG